MTLLWFYKCTSVQHWLSNQSGNQATCIVLGYVDLLNVLIVSSMQ